MMLPRCAVYVTESAQSLNRQTALRSVLFNLFQQVASSHPEFGALMIREIVRTVTINDPKVEARMDAIMEMQEIRDFAKFKADISGLEATTQGASLHILMSKMPTMQIIAEQGIMPQQEGQEGQGGMEVEQSQLQSQQQPQGQPAEQMA